MVVSTGIFYLQQMTDAGSALSSALIIEPSAKTLQLSPAAATFDTNKIHHDGDEEAWIAPTLLNGWVDFAAGWTTAGYRKSANGDIHIRLMIKNGTLGATVFILPVGYRPLANRMFSGNGNGGTSVRWDIAATGDVVMSTGGAAVFSSLECVFRP